MKFNLYVHGVPKKIILGFQLIKEATYICPIFCEKLHPYLHFEYKTFLSDKGSQNINPLIFNSKIKMLIKEKFLEREQILTY